MSTRTRTARIDSVEPLQGFVLRLGFDDGSVREIDLEAELWGPVFEPLHDLDLFRQVRVDGELGTIVWPNGADMVPMCSTEMDFSNVGSSISSRATCSARSGVAGMMNSAQMLRGGLARTHAAAPRVVVYERAG